jgi:hypothetical protein
MLLEDVEEKYKYTEIDPITQQQIVKVNEFDKLPIFRLKKEFIPCSF